MKDGQIIENIGYIFGPITKSILLFLGTLCEP